MNRNVSCKAGIDTAAIIEQLMAFKSRRLATYQVKKIGYETKTTTLDELRSKVSALNSSVTSISNADTLDAFKASTSDGTVLGVAASEDAGEGSLPRSVANFRYVRRNKWGNKCDHCKIICSPLGHNINISKFFF